jgi:hypothetical protein
MPGGARCGCGGRGWGEDAHGCRRALNAALMEGRGNGLGVEGTPGRRRGVAGHGGDGGAGGRGRPRQVGPTCRLVRERGRR